jgi:hypothetical protein
MDPNILAALKPLIMEAVLEALSQVASKAITTPGERWEQTYKDLRTELERQSWVMQGDGYRYCNRCQAWEQKGHDDNCFWSEWTRDGRKVKG